MRILILGGGFGGVYTAMALQKVFRRRHHIDITLIDQKNYFVFQPMLAEVISGSVDILHTVTPFRDLCPGISLHVGEIDRVDMAKKVVVVNAGLHSQPLTIAYDHVVLALGRVENFSMVRGLQEHGFHFKNLGDALVLRSRLISLLETADSEPDAETRRKLLTVVMAGGGFSGVEAIAAVNDFMRKVIHRYSRLDPSELRMILLQSGTRILPELPASLSLYAQRLLDRRRVELRLRTRLTAVTADEAILNDGKRIATKTVIATVGAASNPVLTALPCEQQQGRIRVDAHLEVPGYPGVWALGDCAYIADAKSGAPCPPTAQYAVAEAKCLAANIVASIDGSDKKPFAFRAVGMMGSIGHHSAVGQVMGVKVSGLLAWVLWRAVYWNKLPGFRRRFHVVLDWLLEFVFPKDLVQLDIAPSQDMNREHFEAGEIIFRQGDVGDRVYVIIDGEVEIVHHNAHGEASVIARRKAGDCIGEMALIAKAPRSATARAVTHMDALTLHRNAFDALFTHIPALRESFERLMQERSRAPETELAPSRELRNGCDSHEMTS